MTLLMKCFINVRFFKVNSMPAVCEHLTANFNVDQVLSYCVVYSSLLRLDPVEIVKLDEQVFIILKSTSTSPKTRRKIHTKSYVDLKRKRIDLIYQQFLTMKILNLIETT